MNLLSQIYEKAPVWAQNVMVNAYGLMWRSRRYGGDFNSLLKDFHEREAYGERQWVDYQNAEITRLFKSSMDVPYYRERLSPVRIESNGSVDDAISSLKKWPLLDKETIRKDPSAFIRQGHPRLHSELTSGTTGTPLDIRISDATYKKIHAAYEVRCRNWAGVDRHMSRAMIGGRLVVPKAESKPPFWRYNHVEKQLYLSAFHVSSANASCYADALNQYRPDYLVGYAVSHFLLASFLDHHTIRVHQPKAILTSSEKLSDEMRSVLEKVYGCPVFDAYSGVEFCCLVSECQYHKMHISPDVGYVELLDDDGNEVKEGEMGQIVATGFLNHDQPLIRYQTGDFAVLSGEKCRCGRSMPVIREILGRIEDLVITRDGRQMVRFHGIFVGIPHIREGQVIQESIDRFRLKVVTDEGFNEDDQKLLHKRFKDRIGEIHLEIERVDAIERTKRGKFKAVISNIKAEK